MGLPQNLVIQKRCSSSTDGCSRTPQGLVDEYSWCYGCDRYFQIMDFIRWLELLQIQKGFIGDGDGLRWAWDQYISPWKYLHEAWIRHRAFAKRFQAALLGCCALSRTVQCRLSQLLRSNYLDLNAGGWVLLPWPNILKHGANMLGHVGKSAN